MRRGLIATHANQPSAIRLVGPSQQECLRLGAHGPGGTISIIPTGRKLHQREIQATDEEIDALVNELYGLTEEEIAIVEGQEE